MIGDGDGLMGGGWVLVAMTTSLGWIVGARHGAAWGLLVAGLLFAAMFVASLFLIATTQSTRVAAIGRWSIYGLTMFVAIALRRQDTGAGGWP